LPAASAFLGRSTAFADLEDRGVQDEVGVLLGELALLLERVDLVVLADEEGLTPFFEVSQTSFQRGL